MALLLAQGDPASVLLGPFVQAADGDTLLTALTLGASDVFLSLNAVPFAAKHDASPAVHAHSGYYRVPLDGTDTATGGQGRLVVAMPGALVVWQDFFVVSRTTYLQLAGLSVVPILHVGTPVPLILGPFVSASDGVTLVSDLALLASDVTLSQANGAVAPLHSGASLVPLGLGMYRADLDGVDTGIAGALQVSCDPASAGCLPVWMDVTVVQAGVWQVFFPPPPVPARPTPPPAPPPLPTQPPMPLGTFGTFHFNLAKHAAFIRSHGVAVWVSPHLACPCLLDGGQPDLLCGQCGGLGRFYPPPLAFPSMMLFTQDSPVHTLQETGYWTAGTVRATILPGVELAYEDYVRQVDVKTTFANEVLVKGLSDTLLFRYGTTVQVIADRTRLYRPGVDYTVASNVIVWTPGGQAPDFGEQYSVRYQAYPEYLVSPQTPGLRIENRTAQSRVVTLHLLEKLTAAPTLAP